MRTLDVVFPVQSCTCRADWRSAGCCPFSCGGTMGFSGLVMYGLFGSDHWPVASHLLA